MADLEVASMTDEAFADHWRARSNTVGTYGREDAAISFLQMQVDWLEEEDGRWQGYRIKDEYRDDARVTMLREFTKRRYTRLFGPSRG